MIPFRTRVAAAGLLFLLGLATSLSAQSAPAEVATAPRDKPKPQEEKQPPPLRREEPPLPPMRLEEDGGGGFIDLEWLEIQSRVGIAFFSDSYKIDPSPQVSLLLHAPMPWLSPSSDPGGEYFGIFMELTVLPVVERNLDPPPDKTSGTCLFVSLGLDFTILRNQTFFLTVQAGGQYGTYGGISDLSNGLAAVAGINFGVYVGGGLTLTLAQEVVFADGDNHILMSSLGLVIEF